MHPISKKLQPSEGLQFLEGFGKRYHAILRSRLMKSVQSIRQSGQFGRYAGQQCTTAMLAKQHQLPDGALCIDIKGAFHCLLRELAMESRDQFPRHLQEVLLQEGFNLQTLTNSH